MIEIAQYIFIGLVFGVFAEIIANKLNFWRYRAAWMPVNNIVFMFGFINGSIALFVKMAPFQFLLAALIGTLYEIANVKFLHWWTFPDNQMGPIKGLVPIFAVLAVAWGSVPVLIGVAANILSLS